MATTNKRVRFWLPVAIIFVAGLVYVFWPRPLELHLTAVSEGSIRTTVSDDGDTRIHDVYTLSAPITGKVRRIHYDVGDTVIAAQTVIAEIEPTESAFLDPRTRAQTLAAKQAAESARDLAREEGNQAQADYEFADNELARIRPLALSGTVSQHDLDYAMRQYKTAKARLATSQAALQMREYEVKQLDAQLMSPTQSDAGIQCTECMSIRAPISGTILKVVTRSEGVVQAGTPLIEIGDPKDLEVVVELLSSDAVAVTSGMQVELTNWGGEGILNGQVQRVEPFGYTKYSALGIEEQRVNVIVALISPYERWSRLGHGYQLDATIVLQQAENVVKVPVTSLFREGGEWHVFVVRAQHVAKQAVELGLKNTEQVQVINGLAVGEKVVTYPNETISAGDRVQPRNPA